MVVTPQEGFSSHEVDELQKAFDKHSGGDPPNLFLMRGPAMDALFEETGVTSEVAASHTKLTLSFEEFLKLLRASLGEPKVDAPAEASSKLRQEQIKQFQEAFNLFDEDGDGTIDTKELGSVMRSLGENPTEAELQDIINDVDDDGSGSIGFDEFLTLMGATLAPKNTSRSSSPEPLVGSVGSVGSGDVKISSVPSSGPRRPFYVFGTMQMASSLEEIFKKFDADGNGYITKDELKQALEMAGRTITDEEMEFLWHEVDTNGDGAVCCKEFVRVL